MKKHTYRVEHNGNVFTRTTARTYTHCVVVPVTITSRIEAAKRQAAYDWKANHSYHSEWANGTSRFLTRNSWETEEAYSARIAKDVERSKAWLALGEQGLIEQGIAWARERSADVKLDADGDTFWCLSGWCGRYDLAVKLAAKDAGAVIIEAVLA